MCDFYEDLFKSSQALSKGYFSNKELEWIKSKMDSKDDVKFMSSVAEKIYQAGSWNL